VRPRRFRRQPQWQATSEATSASQPSGRPDQDGDGDERSTPSLWRVLLVAAVVARASVVVVPAASRRRRRGARVLRHDHG